MILFYFPALQVGTSSARPRIKREAVNIQPGSHVTITSPGFNNNEYPASSEAHWDFYTDADSVRTPPHKLYNPNTFSEI